MAEWKSLRVDLEHEIEKCPAYIVMGKETASLKYTGGKKTEIRLYILTRTENLNVLERSRKRQEGKENNKLI